MIVLAFIAKWSIRGLIYPKKHNAIYKYVECYLNEINVIKNRLKKRTRMISQIQDVVSEKGFLEWVDNSKKPSDIDWLRVDSGKPIESYIDEVILYIHK